MWQNKWFSRLSKHPPLRSQLIRFLRAVKCILNMKEQHFSPFQPVKAVKALYPPPSLSLPCALRSFSISMVCIFLLIKHSQQTAWLPTSIHLSTGSESHDVLKRTADWFLVVSMDTGLGAPSWIKCKHWVDEREMIETVLQPCPSF